MFLITFFSWFFHLLHAEVWAAIAHWIMALMTITFGVWVYFRDEKLKKEQIRMTRLEAEVSKILEARQAAWKVYWELNKGKISDADIKALMVFVEDSMYKTLSFTKKYYDDMADVYRNLELMLKISDMEYRKEFSVNLQQRCIDIFSFEESTV